MEMMDWKKNSSCAYFEYDMIDLRGASGGIFCTFCVWGFNKYTLCLLDACLIR